MIRYPIRMTACASAALLLAACGGGSESTASGGGGELRTFTYEDTVSDEILAPYKAANPDVDVRTATFESLDEAAAKLKSGFSTDVIEVCLDEAKPLLENDLLAPIDTSKLSNWDALSTTFRDANGVTVDGNVIMVPVSSGPHGMIYSTKDFPDGVDSYAALFDPANKGKVALDGGWLTALADTALASGIKDPISMTDAQVGEMKDKIIAALHDGQFRTISQSDSDQANLFKSGEIVLADGGRGTAEQINSEDGAVTWVAPKEGTLSWVCGLGISADAADTDAAYAFINDYIGTATQAVVGDLGYVITNPTALPEVSEEFRKGADPAEVKGTIPQVEPANAEVWRSAWQEIEAGG
ncbi:extracellular solute-binding protein [Mycolicibacterium sp. 624]|uniref:ABC transporter substrate-binding protein n=1 Tax=Mycolicibacterium sp. 624 TaxID=3156314 RepID=UPI00339B2692